MPEGSLEKQEGWKETSWRDARGEGGLATHPAVNLVPGRIRTGRAGRETAFLSPKEVV